MAAAASAGAGGEGDVLTVGLPPGLPSALLFPVHQVQGPRHAWISTPETRSSDSNLPIWPPAACGHIVRDGMLAFSAQLGTLGRTGLGSPPCSGLYSPAKKLQRDHLPRED